MADRGEMDAAIEAGLRAGSRLAESGLADGIPVLAAGACVTAASVLLPLLVARRLLALRPGACAVVAEAS